MRVAIAGSGLLAHEMFRAIAGSPHTVVALVQDGRRTKGMQRWLAGVSSVLPFSKGNPLRPARAHRVLVIYIDKMTAQELDPLERLRPDLLLVGGFGIILKKPLLTLPRIGCVNTHSSLLPRHRGPNPFTATILSGDTEGGITFHVMDEGIDTGAILDQHRFPIKPNYVALDLHRISCRLAGEKIVALLDRVEAEGLKGTPQNEEEATYEKNPRPCDVTIRWDRPAIEIDRVIRACFANSMARFEYRGRTVYVNRVKFSTDPVDAPPGTVLEARPGVKIATGRGTVSILYAFTLDPVPWVWPGFFSRPAPGERVE